VITKSGASIDSATVVSAIKLLDLRTLTPTNADAGGALVGSLILFACQSPDPARIIAAAIRALEAALSQLAERGTSKPPAVPS